MNWKQFLKPNLKKIVLFVILLIAFLVLLNFYPNSGYPLPFVNEINLWPSGMAIEPIQVNLLINPIIWYLFTCFVVWIYDRIRKK